MRALSPQRRLSVTKNTNYPSVGLDRRPSECGQASHANMKSASQELSTSQQRLEKQRRKSLTEMNNQRKILEKSMIAYTEKMKDLTDHRTNTIFKGIQIRIAKNGEKTGPSSLPASVDLNDVTSVPVDSARLRRKRIHMRKQGMMTERLGIKTPIEEEQENSSEQSTRPSGFIRSTSADILRKRQILRYTNESSANRIRYSSPDVFLTASNKVTRDISENKDTVRSDTCQTEDDSRVSVTVVQNENTVGSYASRSYPTTIVEIMTNPKIHIIAEDKTEEPSSDLEREKSFYDDSSDSAYSSCLSDEESSTAGSVDRSETDSITSEDTEHKAKNSVRFVEPNPEDGYLLTVPKVHKRKRKSRAKTGTMSLKKKGDTLLKKAILNGATSKHLNIEKNQSF